MFRGWSTGITLRLERRVTNNLLQVPKASGESNRQGRHLDKHPQQQRGDQNLETLGELIRASSEYKTDTTSVIYCHLLGCRDVDTCIKVGSLLFLRKEHVEKTQGTEISTLRI